MTAVDNAVDLMSSGTLMAKVKAVSVYVARQVVIEAVATPNHAKRMQLAQAVIYNPMVHNTLLTNIIACDPDICGATGDATQLADGTLITKMTDLWTPVAQMLFP